MKGDSLVGFGIIQYHYSTDREGDWMLTGYSPRKQNLTLYFMGGFDKVEEPLSCLGKHKTGIGCLSIKRLAEVDLDILQELVEQSVKQSLEIYPPKGMD